MAVRRKPLVPVLLCVYLMGSFYPISLLKTVIAPELMRVTLGPSARPKGIVHLNHTSSTRLDSYSFD